MSAFQDVGAEGRSCDALLMRVVRLELNEETGTSTFAPEMEAAPSTAARVYLVTSESNYQNHQQAVLVPGLQGIGSGEAIEILWRGTVDNDRTQVKPLHRTFNPAAQEDNSYFSSVNVVGQTSDLFDAQEPAMAVDQSNGNIYIGWVDASIDGSQTIYTSEFLAETEAFGDPEVLVDLGVERHATRPAMSVAAGKTVYVAWDQEEFIDGINSCEASSSYASCSESSTCVSGEICSGTFCIQPAPCRYEVHFFAYGAHASD
jgi:hypothetical protein